MNPNVQAAQSALTAFQGSQKSANDILNDAMTQYGVQGAQTTKDNLETTLNNTTKALNAVPDSVTGRTSRSLVTEAQRQAIVNNEQNPIRQALSDQQGEYGIASNNYSDLSGKATTLANAELGQQTAKESQLEQNYQDAVSQAAAQVAAQQEAAKEAEAKREFDISAAQSNRSAANSAAASQASQQSSVIGGMATELQKITGSDGYVSPQGYAAAKKAWVAQGYSPAQFDASFAGYRNPKNKYYKLG